MDEIEKGALVLYCVIQLRTHIPKWVAAITHQVTAYHRYLSCSICSCHLRNNNEADTRRKDPAAAVLEENYFVQISFP